MVVIPSESRHSTATGNTSVTKVRKSRVYLEYPCYICGNILSGAKSAINHANRIHGFDIPTRMIGRKRPQDDNYEFTRDRNAEVDEMHYSCSSCWFHCPEDDGGGEGIRVLNEHVRAEHDPIKVDITKDGEDTTQIGSRRNSRTGSVDNRSQQSDYDDEDEEDGNRGQGSGGERRTNANRGRNQTSDSGGGKYLNNKSNSGGSRDGDKERSNGGGGGGQERRSTTPNGTPITEESAKEISSKLEELTKLFKDFFSSQK